MNNKFFSREEQGIFGSYPVLTDDLTVKTEIEAGDIIGVAENGDYGKYSAETYKQVYAIAYNQAKANEKCVAILSACVLESFVKFPEKAAEKKLKIKQELKKVSIFIK